MSTIATMSTKSKYPRVNRKNVLTVLDAIDQEILAAAILHKVTHRNCGLTVNGFDPRNGSAQVKDASDDVKSLYWQFKACETYGKDVRGRYIAVTSHDVFSTWVRTRREIAQVQMVGLDPAAYEYLRCQGQVHVLDKLAQAFGIEVQS